MRGVADCVRRLGSGVWASLLRCPSMRVRRAEVSDAEALCEIYNEEVLNGLTTFDLVPRSLDAQRSWVREHQGAHLAIVAVRPTFGGDASGGEEQVLGFGALSPYRDRPAYATTVEDSLYVQRSHRGQGLGKVLLDHLVDLAGDHGFHAVIARIVGHNEVSIGLHLACGFRMVGVEREVGRKHGRWLDVVELQRVLAQGR